MASSTDPMPKLPTINLGRERDKKRSDKWSFYLRGEGEESRTTLNMVKAATAAHKAKVPGSSAALESQLIYSHGSNVTWILLSLCFS